MNLRLIERRFQNLDAHANFVNYKYNPHTQKVKGIGQHAYIEHLKEDFQSDVKIFGADPFYSKKVDNLVLQKSKNIQLGNKVYENPQSSLFKDIDDKFELDNKRYLVNTSYNTHKHPTADDEKSETDHKELNQRPHTTNIAAGNREFKIKRFGAVTKAEKNERFSFKASSLGRMFQSQRNLIQKKINYYQKNTHYEWGNNQGLSSEPTLQQLQSHQNLKVNNDNLNDKSALKQSQLKFQYGTSSTGQTQSQSKSNFLLNTSSRKPQDTIYKSQNLFDLAAKAEEKAIQQQILMKNQKNSLQNSLRAYESQEQKPKVMFGEISGKSRQFKNPARESPIQNQVAISKESILRKKKLEWVVNSLKNIKIPIQILQRLEKQEQDIQNMEKKYQNQIEKEQKNNILQKLIETQRMIITEETNREKYNLSNHIQPNSNDIVGNNQFMQRKKTQTYGEKQSKLKKVIAQNYKSGVISSSYDIAGSVSNSQKQQQQSLKVNNLVISSQNINQSKQKSLSKNFQKSDEVPAQLGISGQSSQHASLRNNARIISPNKMSPRFMAKNTSNPSKQMKAMTFGGSQLYSADDTPQDTSFIPEQINPYHQQNQIIYIQHSSDQTQNQLINQVQTELQNHLPQFNRQQSNIESSQILYQTQNKESNENKYSQNNESKINRNERMMGNVSNDINYQSNIVSTFRELSPQSVSANRQSQRISTQIISGDASFLKTVEQFYQNKDELTIQNQGESIAKNISSGSQNQNRDEIKNNQSSQQLIQSKEKQKEKTTQKNSVKISIDSKQDELGKIPSHIIEGNISIVNKERSKIKQESLNQKNSVQSISNYNSSFFQKKGFYQGKNQISPNIKESQNSQIVELKSNQDLIYDYNTVDQLNLQNQFIDNLRFILKLTDISELTNPFVVYDDIPVTKEGIIAIQYRYPFTYSLTAMLPWINHEHDIFRRTIKIEVLLKDQLIMQRYFHMDNLYPLEYSKLALQVSYNLYQTQYLKYKQSKIQQFEEEQKASQTELLKNQNADIANAINSKQGQQAQNATQNDKSTQKGRDEDPYIDSELRMKSSSNTNLLIRGLQFEEKFGLLTQTMNFSTESLSKEFQTNRIVAKQFQLQFQQDIGPIYVFDGASNIVINQDESLLYYNIAKIQPERDFFIKNFNQNFVYNDLSTERIDRQNKTIQQIFYYMNPARDRNYQILKDLQLHKFHLKDIHEQIQSQEIMKGSGINSIDLIRFPKFQKNQLRILIEFQDCIIKSNDLIDFQIIVDDNQLRANVLLDFEESLQPTLQKGIQGTQFCKDYNQMKSFNQLFRFSDSFSVIAKQPEIQQKEEEKQKYTKDFKQAVQTRGMDVLIRKNITKKVNDNRKKTLENQIKGNQDKITEKLLNDDTIVTAKILYHKNQQKTNNEIINFSLQSNEHQDPFSFYSQPEYEFNEYKPILRSMVHVQQNFYDNQKIDSKFGIYKKMSQKHEIIIKDTNHQNKIVLPDGFDVQQIRSRSNLMVDTQTPSAYGMGNYINIQNNEQVDAENFIHQFELKKEKDGLDQIYIQNTKEMNLKDGVVTLLPIGQSQISDQSPFLGNKDSSGIVTLKMGAHRNTLGFEKNSNQITEINTELVKLQIAQDNRSQQQNKQLNSLINQIGQAYKNTPNGENAKSINNSIPNPKFKNNSPSSIGLRSVISNSQQQNNIKNISPLSKEDELNNKILNKDNLHIQGNRITQISQNEKAKLPQKQESKIGKKKNEQITYSQNYSLLQLNKFNSASNSIGLNLNLESNQNELNSITKSAVFERGKVYNGISQNIHSSNQKQDINIQRSSYPASSQDNMSSTLYKNRNFIKKTGQSNRQKSDEREDTVDQMIIFPSDSQNIIKGQRSIIQEVEIQQENQNSSEQLIIISRNDDQKSKE